MAKNQNQAPKGTQDFFSEDTHILNYVENTLSDVAKIYGFSEVRTPMFEHTEVFTGSVGETSDIVQKEMYTFLDKGDRSITLRPELTAGTVRAMLEHGRLNDALPVKAYYIGPCFRYERPQAGRYREFHQFGVEWFGSAAPSADADLILFANDLLETVGISGHTLKINSIGCPDCRPQYLETLKEYFRNHKDQLDEDSLLRLETNPMRILDTKVETTREIVKDAPKSHDFLCESCKEHFNEVLSYLDLFGISYEVDTTLVRGLDYYTRTVFEFVSNNLGAQGTIIGGGRYDSLVEARGGKSTPALGFGMGMERLVLEMKAINAPIPETLPCELYFASTGASEAKKAFILTHILRNEGFYAEYDVMNRSLKAQMKYANKIGAHYTLVIGESELLTGKGKLRHMASGTETDVLLDETIVDVLYNNEIELALQNMEDDTPLYVDEAFREDNPDEAEFLESEDED